MTDEKKKEFTRRISEANPTEMVVILYDIALTYVEEGQEAFDAGDPEGFRKALGRVRATLTELMNSLNIAYEPAPAMMQLYRFCIRRLARSEAANETEGLREVWRVLDPLRDSYASLAAQTSAAPVMGNSQTVVAGLTYGRGSLNENLTGDTNRGFLV